MVPLALGASRDEALKRGVAREQLQEENSFWAQL